MTMPTENLMALLAAANAGEDDYDDEEVFSAEYDDDDDEDVEYDDDDDEDEELAERRYRRRKYFRYRGKRIPPIRVRKTGKRTRSYGAGTIGTSGGKIRTKRGTIGFKFKEPVATQRQMNVVNARIKKSVNQNADAIKKLTTTINKRFRVLNKIDDRIKKGIEAGFRKQSKSFDAKIKKAESNSMMMAMLFSQMNTSSTSTSGDGSNNNMMMIMMMMMMGGMGKGSNNMMMIMMMMMMMNNSSSSSGEAAAATP